MMSERGTSCNTTTVNKMVEYDTFPLENDFDAYIQNMDIGGGGGQCNVAM